MRLDVVQDVGPHGAVRAAAPTSQEDFACGRESAWCAHAGLRLVVEGTALQWPGCSLARVRGQARAQVTVYLLPRAKPCGFSKPTRAPLSGPPGPGRRLQDAEQFQDNDQHERNAQKPEDEAHLNLLEVMEITLGMARRRRDRAKRVRASAHSPPARRPQPRPPQFQSLPARHGDATGRGQGFLLHAASGLSDITAAVNGLRWLLFTSESQNENRSFAHRPGARLGHCPAAQDSSNYDTRDTTAAHRPTAAATEPRTRRHRRADKSAIRRTGEKLGHATERLPGNRSGDPATTDASRSGTRSMGAAGSDASVRQRRMDDAYNSWRSRQK